MSLVPGTWYQIPGTMGLDKSLAHTGPFVPKTWYQIPSLILLVPWPAMTPHPTSKLHAEKPTYTLCFVVGLAQWNEPGPTRAQ